MNVWVNIQTDGLMDDWKHDWLNVCVGCLLVVDLLGIWRGVKPRKCWNSDRYNYVTSA